MAEQEQEEKRLRRDFDKQALDLKAVLESQRIKKQQAAAMKRKLAAQNAAIPNPRIAPPFKSEDYIDDENNKREAALTTLGEAEARLRAELEDKLAELRRMYKEKMRNVSSQPAKTG